MPLVLNDEQLAYLIDQGFVHLVVHVALAAVYHGSHKVVDALDVLELLITPLFLYLGCFLIELTSQLYREVILDVLAHEVDIKTSEELCEIRVTFE